MNKKLIFILYFCFSIILLLSFYYVTNESFEVNDNKVKKKNLVFTSAGDNTNFDNLWCNSNKNYDVWVVYYGKNENNYNKYKSKVDFILKRKGSKFQNFHYIYNKYRNELDKYERFFILDDDIIIDTDEINRMFEISKKYNLWLCGPTFKNDGSGKISHEITKQVPNNFLRYCNFVEVNVPLFNKYALNKLMNFYDPILIGWGIDYLYIWALTNNKKESEYKRRIALIDSVSCINPFDDKKNNRRELNNITNVNRRAQDWDDFRKKYNIKVSKKINYKFLKNNNNLENFNNKKEIFAIHSVFIAKENILFLEEWIDYHIQLGFNKFYLYDNSKVQKPDVDHNFKKKWIANKTNKYGVNYDELVNLTDYQIKNALQKIQSKYKNKVYFIEWSPKDKNGNIVHNQGEALNISLKKLKDEKIVDWCASIDMDEFIVINSGKTNSIQSFVNKLDSNVSNIKMGQIRFDSRFNNLDKRIVEISESEYDGNNFPDKYHSPKYIFKVKNTNKLEIHNWYGDGKEIYFSQDKICFNHYKSNGRKNVYNNINEEVKKNIIKNSKTYVI